MAIQAAKGMGYFIVVSLDNGHDLCSVRLRLVPSKLQPEKILYYDYNKLAFEEALIQITL